MDSTTMSRLYEPFLINGVQLNHRVVMAPLTRFRADDDHVQLPMSVEYYSQRASVPGTLLITESSLISPDHCGTPNAPGMWNDEQVEAWRKVTDAVHARDCRVFCQLLAPGRVADADVTRREAGHGALSSSAVPLSDDTPVPEAMCEDQIQAALCDYATAAKNAIRAGFDGVEIHGGNGYLIDQFLQTTCNQRTDQWGGSVENRARFGIEVARAVANTIGADKLGFRMSPWSSFQGMRMEDDEVISHFTYLIRRLRDLNLGYLHVIESRVKNNVDVGEGESILFALEAWGKSTPVLVAGGFTPELAMQAIDEEYKEYAVAVVFGRRFLANPDLPFRIRHGLELNQYDRATFYKPKSAAGYIDYPFSEEFLSGDQGS